MMNSVNLVGRITKELSLRYTPNGVATVAFTVAVNRAFSNQNGEREADFINVVAWRQQAENLCNYQGKGSLIGITGRIQTRNYDGQDGKRVYVTEVVAENIAFLGSRSDSDGNNTNPNTNSYNSNQNSNRGQNNQSRIDDDPFANDGKPIDISDDDLPF